LDDELNLDGGSEGREERETEIPSILLSRGGQNNSFSLEERRDSLQKDGRNEAQFVVFLTAKGDSIVRLLPVGWKTAPLRLSHGGVGLIAPIFLLSNGEKQRFSPLFSFLSLPPSLVGNEE